MTDNAFVYSQNKSFKQLLHRCAIGHIRTRPYTPRTNGKVERLQRSVAPTQRPATGHPEPAFGMSSGTTPRVAPGACEPSVAIVALPATRRFM